MSALNLEHYLCTFLNLGGVKMRLVSASSFFRLPFDQKCIIEDGSFVNPCAGLFGVVDGVSAAFSPKNPPLIYPGGLTGGQVVSRLACAHGALAYPGIYSGLEGFTKIVNNEILEAHLSMGQDPKKENVGGASFAFCQIKEDGLYFLLGGDCFAFCKSEKGLFFFSGFDQAAYDVEDQANKNYVRCLEKASGDKGVAWDIYYLQFKAKRYKYANRNLGKGGYAVLNGDPALEKCWTYRSIESCQRPSLLLMFTDGMLPSEETNPENNKELAKMIDKLYLKGGLSAILKWRDETEKSLAHITGWPEATAVELQFSY